MPRMAEDFVATDRCAQCHVVGLPLLAPDEPVGVAQPTDSTKPRYVYVFQSLTAMNAIS
jgi:hypothetical protein